MTHKVHAAAAGIAMAVIAGFWSSTVASEAFLGHEAIAAVKTAIAYAIPLLVLAMAVTGISGRRLAAKMKGPVIARKIVRLKIAAANGILILVPSALFLAWKAGGGEFDGMFYTVQAAELLAGATNFTLFAMNAMDGRRLKNSKAHRHQPA